MQAVTAHSSRSRAVSEVRSAVLSVVPTLRIDRRNRDVAILQYSVHESTMSGFVVLNTMEIRRVRMRISGRDPAE